MRMRKLAGPISLILAVLMILAMLSAAIVGIATVNDNKTTSVSSQI